MPLNRQELEILFQECIAGITGLPGRLVRPHRQENGGPQVPPDAVDWAAFGILSWQTQGFPEIKQREEQSRFVVYRDLTLLVSFYGPNAQDCAQLLMDGMHLAAAVGVSLTAGDGSAERHYAPLRKHGLAFVRQESLIPMPERTPKGWRHRMDLTLLFTLKIVREYYQPSLAGISGKLVTDTGLSRPLEGADA